MTAERRKAILYLSLTLILGILIGAMGAGFFGRMRHEKMRGGMERRGMDRNPSGDPDESGRGRREGRRAGFEKMIFRVTKADSDQIRQIKPILAEMGARVEALEKQSEMRMGSMMDTLKLKLQPILHAEQMERLEEFSKKARERRRR